MSSSGRKRWRCGTVLACRHAFESAGFRVGSGSGEVLRDCFLGHPISLDPELVEITDLSFPEVPSRFALESLREKGNGFSTTMSSDLEPRRHCLKSYPKTHPQT